MNKVLKSLCIASAALAVALAGCGGGGGGGGTTSGGGTTNPPLGQSRVITGKVVSTATGSPGVAGVLVALGDRTVTGITATTDASGNFTLNLGTVDIQPFIQVDVSSAGANYSNEFTVSYNNQDYPAGDITVPVDVRNEATTSLGTIVVTYHDPTSDTPPPMNIYTNHDTVITGRIIKSDTGTGLQGVTVRFGTPSVVATSGQKGYFALNLGREPQMLVLFPPGSQNFSIDSSTAGSTYPTTLEVLYSSQFYTQSSIPVPQDILLLNSTDLGALTLEVSASGGSGDGGTPPPPPL